MGKRQTNSSMEGIRYLVNEEQQPVAVQIDLEKYGELWEDFYDVLVAQARRQEESIPLEEVIEEFKAFGKLSQDV